MTTAKETFQVDVRGTYNPGKVVVVKTPQDLIKNGIFVSPEAVKATWGEVATHDYVLQRQAAQTQARSR